MFNFAKIRKRSIYLVGSVPKDGCNMGYQSSEGMAAGSKI
jgi:hypothetical protein